MERGADVADRSRAPLAWRLVVRRHLRAAIYILLLVTTYCRPSELLRAQAGDLFAPARSVVGHWSFLFAFARRPIVFRTCAFGPNS